MNRVYLKVRKRKFISKPIKSKEDAYEFFKPLFKDCMHHHEEMHVIAIDNSNTPISTMLVGSGGITATVVDIRIIMQYLLLSNATAFVVAHNHPSGSTKPSVQDMKLTDMLKASSETLDITLLDSLIITDTSCHSILHD